MYTAKRPYWDRKKDRWTLLVAGVLLLVAIWMKASNFGMPPEVVAPVITAPAADSAVLAGQPGVLTGVAAPNAPVRVLDDDVTLGETTADVDGQWRVAVPALAPGTHTLTVQTLDEDGNVAATSEPLVVTVSEPAASAGAPPAIKLPAGGLPADTPLTLEGTGSPGTTVQVYDGDQVVGETIVAPDGTWKLTLPPLTLGAHSLVAKQVGADGKEQAASAPVELTVADGQIVVATPAAVAGATAAPGAGAPAIKLPAAGLKASEPLTLEGTGTPGSTVTVYDGDEVVGQTTVGPDGTWQITLPPPTAGTHSLVAKQVGADGKEQAASAPVELTVADGQIVVATPAAVAGATAAPGAGAPAIKLPVAGLKASEPLMLEGTGTPGSTVTVYDGDEVVGQTTVGPDGTWQITLPPPTAGTHSLVAKQVGADGKEQAASAPVELTVADGQIVVATPAAVAGATAAPGAGAPAIKLPVAGLKASAPLMLEGTGTPGSTVTVYDGDEVVGQTTVGPDGTWQMPLPPLTLGAHSLVAKQVGADGKEQAASAPVELTVADGQIVVATPAAVAGATAAPGAGAPAIKLPVAGLKASAPLMLEGTGTPGSTVTVYDGDEVVGQTTVGPDGTWQMPLPPLTLGAHSLVAKQIGADGKEQAASAPVELTVADGQIVVATPAAVAQATAVTGTATPVPGGAAAPTVEPTSAMVVGAATVAPTVAVATTSEPAPAAIAGAATAVATSATDLPPTDATPAVTAPMVATPVGATGEAGAPMTLEGTGVPGATVRVYDGDKPLGETTVGADGKWKLTLPALAAGAYSLIAKLLDAGGKELVASQPLSITIPTPSGAAGGPPVITPPTGDQLARAAPVELSGTAAPGSSIKLYDGAKLIGEATADADGNWTMTVAPLAAGEHSLTAITYSPDGEVQGASEPLIVNVPVSQPAAGAGGVRQPTIGWPPDGSVVVTARPLMAGQAFPGGVVRVFDGDVLLGETIADSHGRWALRPSEPLAAGQHVLTAAATSPDGLTTLESLPVTVAVRAQSVVIPSLKPESGAAPVVVNPADGSTVNTAQPFFTGMVAPNTVVRLYDGAQVMGEATSDPDGRWSFRPTSPLAEGEHTITVAPLNPDGTESTVKSMLNFTVDSGRGTAPIQLPLVTSKLPEILSNSRPALTGQVTPGATIQIYDGDQLVGEVKAGPDGRWYFVPTAPLAPGPHVLRVQAVGPDGAMLASAEYPITVAAGAKPIEPPKIVSPKQGQVVPGGVLSGTAPAGSQVQIFDGDRLLGATTAGANGKWRFKLPKDLQAGKHLFKVAILDQAGKPVAESVSVPVEVTPPATLPVTGSVSAGR